MAAATPGGPQNVLRYRTRGARLVKVAGQGGATRRQLVGRAGEIEAVLALVRGAAHGEAGTLLVSGEAGVGKTALVREACALVGDVADVVWGSCLPLMSLSVPFLPLTSALRAWAGSRDAPPPVLGGAGDVAAGFDAWLSGVCRERPLLLVVDDLQWADQSSLDVLMYAVAGPPDRRLGLVTTARSGEEGERLRRWLPDVRRLPRVGELQLDRLDRLATSAQLAALLGRPPHESLVTQVYARTQGNAYLTELMVRGLPSEARGLPPGLPTGLRDAVSRAWYRLSPRARAVTRLVAVAGRPLAADRLGEVSAATGLRGNVVPLLREAVDAAVLEVGPNGTYWFVHPLLAEVLEEGLLPEERAALHAAFAVALERVGGVDDDVVVASAVELADHHFGAGHQQEAYHWALRGANAAERSGGPAEMLKLLRRALELWPKVPQPGLTRIELLRRIHVAAERAGEHEEALAAVEDLLATMDWESDPLLAAELLVRRTCLEGQTGHKSTSAPTALEAMRLSAPYPDSIEYAMAVASLAAAEAWDGTASARAWADEAIRLARACGSPRALAAALIASVVIRVFAADPAALDDARQAQAAATEAKDFLTVVDAAGWVGNSLDVSAASREVIDHSRRTREELAAMGAPPSYMAGLSATEAFGLALLGDWRECTERLRVALGSSPGRECDLVARLTAALLAGWQGRSGEAEAHLARAEELSPDRFVLVFAGFHAVKAEVALAKGDTESAFAAAMAGVGRADHHANLLERLVPQAARALADQAQSLRDQGRSPEPAVTRLRDLRRRYPEVVAEVGPGPMHQAQVLAMQAWYDAEVRRGQDEPAAASAWQHAAQTCAAGQLAWDEAYAWWRTGEALLRERSARDAASAALRRAHRLAGDLAATPLVAEIEALALTARVPLSPLAPPPTPGPAAVLPGLTPREREILAHVVAGRTYAEIARELVISEKTVSAHLSNLLRKTGTTSRVGLAQLARRLAVPATDDGP